ncbi:MAG: GTP-binding protein [Selenomonadaceae bacterium]|nr:GTP-binding protein [Selenomonadaceae bacterium]
MSSLLKFITCGSVDDGKSTLIGNILYNSKLLYADQEKALLLDSKIGSREGEIDYSLLLDGLMAEREQGITIDVAYRYFNTEKRSFIVADTPGHEEYTRNMAVGASFADLAIIMVDAKQGVLIQTRRHARICSLMGISHFIFAVNKMDLLNYDEKRFREITAEIDELVEELKLQDVVIIPVSATEGDNVTKKSANMSWYAGETVLEHLENVDVLNKVENNNFYLPIQRVCRPNHKFRGFQGQVESGEVKVGQEIFALPSNESATVKSILVGDRYEDSASKGQAVTIQLDREVDVSRGCVLSDSTDIPVVRNVSVTLLWMDDEPLTVGKEYLIKLGTKKIAGILSSVSYKVDVNTGEKVKADSLQKNEIALCQLEFTEKIVADVFLKNSTLGELILIDRVSHATSACGVVETVENAEDEVYFYKDDLKAKGYIFEEFFFNLENAFLKRKESDNKFTVGDEVPVVGESFKYPDNFDILAVEEKLVVKIRDRKVEDIIKLKDYVYKYLPVLDTRGFALRITDQADLDNFLYEYQKGDEENKAALHNKWFRFETYRRIICTDNFWTI